MRMAVQRSRVSFIVGGSGSRAKAGGRPAWPPPGVSGSRVDYWPRPTWVAIACAALAAFMALPVAR